MATKKKVPPASTLSGRESQLINAAVDLAEKQIRNGTASSQVITHFLKQGTVRAQLELKRIEQENLLLAAKTEAIKSGKRLEELYAKAIEAMRLYQGSSYDENDDEGL